MRTQCGGLRQRTFFFFVSSVLFLLSTTAAFAQVQPRVVEAVDNARRVTLPGNVHPLARPEFDRGAAPLELPLDRMLLVLKRSPEQDAELKKLLDDQQDSRSPFYRKWLTPDEFGQRFGVAESDILAITDWLAAQGFRVDKVYQGRTLIEFSGSAGQVERAFGTPIHKFMVNGEAHWANATEQQIPEALAPVVAGVFTLHTFRKKPLLHVVEGAFTAVVRPGGKPLLTSATGRHALMPHDYYTIYNTNFVPTANPAKIAIVGISDINIQDVMTFHNLAGDNAGSPQIIVNGADPGNLGGGAELEGVLDTSWAGAVAPNAQVYLIVSAPTNGSDPADLSEAYIVNANAWDVMSESIGVCEAAFTSAQATGVSNLAQQAAVQGITYVVAAGDSGSAGCDDPNVDATATQGLSVNMLASTAYNVAVGGTMFNEHGVDSQYWASTNVQGTLASALSYIPENVWNESCAAGQTGCTKPNIWAGGGGPSQFFTKPSWQTGVAGIPNDVHRDTPDVSLTAAGHDPYLICIENSCTPNAQGMIYFAGVSGTSASTPAFAGIMALVAQQSGVRLGQPNYVLYRLAAAEKLAQCNASSITVPLASNCVFNDVTVGNNAVPGEAAYGTVSATYQSAVGYDLATGLGSVNVGNLISQWNSVTFNPTTSTFAISPTNAVHGTALNVTVKVSPSTTVTGTPSGTVWLIQPYAQGNLVGDNTSDIFQLDGTGSFAGVTYLLPGGPFPYSVHAHYVGDGTFGGSDSTSVLVTIQPEPTTLTVSVLTPNTSGTLVPFTSVPYGTPIYFQAQLGTSGHGTPTSPVTFYDNGNTVVSAFADSHGNAVASNLQLSAGVHSITGTFSGDNSFLPSSNATPVTFTIGQVVSATKLSSQQTAQSFLLSATVTGGNNGAAPTGTVTFNSGNTVLGTAALVAATGVNGTQGVANFDGTQLAPGQYSVIASYAGDTNYTPSVSTALPLSLVADFTVANQGITTQTVTAGQTASYVNDIVVTPLFKFSAMVNLSCLVAAAPTTSCSVSPTSMPAANGVASVSVTTMVRSLSVPEGPRNRPWFIPWAWPGVLVALCLAMACALHARERERRLAGVFALVLLAASLGVGLASCGGGGGGGGSAPPPQSGTPAGTYTVTVTATAGATMHTTALTMIVQ